MSAYLGPRGLEDLRERLSERDLAVARSVESHRFLAAGQIEELHFLDHESDQAGARVCRRVLARLARDRVLVRLQRRIGGVRAGSASFVYALGPAGNRLLRAAGERRRVTEPSPLFLDHTLAVADTHVSLLRAARAGQLRIVGVEVEPASWRRFIGSGGASEIVRPDLYVVTGGTGYEDCWFLEVDRSTESPAAIRRKCQAYDRYFRTAIEQERHGAFPLVVWVTPDEQRTRRIEAAIRLSRGLHVTLFRTTTTNELVELIAGETP